MGTVRDKRLLRSGVLFNGHELTQNLPKKDRTTHSSIGYPTSLQKDIYKMMTGKRFHPSLGKSLEDGEYYFKKAHAFGYAMAVVVHMNLICEGPTQWEVEDYRKKPFHIQVGLEWQVSRIWI